MIIRAYATGGKSGGKGKNPIGVQAMTLRNQGLSERQVENRIMKNTGRSRSSVRTALSRMTFTQ